MKNLYHSDIYKFDTPVSSYWEDTSSENLNLEKLTKDIYSWHKGLYFSTKPKTIRWEYKDYRQNKPPLLIIFL